MLVLKYQNATNRTDVKVLFDNLPEPIDLDLDLNRRMLYWTDRGDPPHGKHCELFPYGYGHEHEAGFGDIAYAFDGGNWYRS